MNQEKIRIEEGTINFWIKEHSLDFNDGKTTQIFDANPEGGSILCSKDKDNKLKFFFVVIGKGRRDIELDVSEYDQNKKYMITFTWNLAGNALKLYINGELRETKKFID
jgi:hypothetical protein